MPLIVETIVTTESAEGAVHIAPLGLTAEGDRWIVAPFKPSRTLENLSSNPHLVASHTDDVRLFAGLITGRKSWPLAKADRVKGHRLADAVSHWELKVEEAREDAERPRLLCRIVHTGNHKPWSGFNRAQAAVIELAVLSTRLSILPAEKIESELKYLEIAVSKTAGEREREAWCWLMERIEAWRRGDPSAGRKL